jgi:hypothetical protein
MFRGLESEGMGLPGDVATHIEVQASPPAYPHALRSHQTPTMHRGVNTMFTAGHRGAWLGSPAYGNIFPSPLPCPWLQRTPLAGLVCVYSDPPYIVW